MILPFAQLYFCHGEMRAKSTVPLIAFPSNICVSASVQCVPNGIRMLWSSTVTQIQQFLRKQKVSHSEVDFANKFYTNQNFKPGEKAIKSIQFPSSKIYQKTPYGNKWLTMPTMIKNLNLFEIHNRKEPNSKWDFIRGRRNILFVAGNVLFKNRLSKCRQAFHSSFSTALLFWGLRMNKQRCFHTPFLHSKHFTGYHRRPG